MPQIKLATKGWVEHEVIRDFPVRPAEVEIGGPGPDGQCVRVPECVMLALREHGRETVGESIHEAALRAANQSLVASE